MCVYAREKGYVCYIYVTVFINILSLEIASWGEG